MRRLLLVLGIGGGLFAWFATRPLVVAVDVEDFVAAKAQAEERSMGFLYRDDTLEEFHTRRTEGRILRRSGEEWAEFHELVRAAVVDGTGDRETLRRLGQSYFRGLFFLPDQPRVAEAFAAFGGQPGLLYVALAASDADVGPHSPTLTLNALDPSDMDHAPGWIARPYSPLAPWLLAGGLACYVLLPRRRRREGGLHYGGMQAIVMPDVLATMLLVVFGGLPLLMMDQFGASALELGGAWIAVLAFWIFLLAPLLIYAITAKNASFALDIEADELRLRTWRGGTTIPFGRIEALRTVEWRTPRWLRLLGMLGILLSWRGIVPANTLRQGHGVGIEIVHRDGAAERIWLAGLHGTPRLLAALDAHGVAMPEEVRALLADDDV